jgi:hypothetical protein
MKTLLSALMAVASISFVSCAPQPGPVRLVKFYGITPGDCTSSMNQKDSIIPNGALDVSSGDAKFFLGVDLKTVALNSPAVVVNGRTIENANREQPLIEQMVLTYSSKAGPAGTKLAAIKQGTVPFVASFIEKDEIFGGTNIITGPAAIAIDALSSSNDSDAYTDLTVDVEFVGRMSGSGARVDTAPQPFVIRLSRAEVPASCIPRKAFGQCNNPNQSYIDVKPVLQCCTGVNAGNGCPNDTDKDGILDPLDECPNSTSMMVNSKGCP